MTEIEKLLLDHRDKDRGVLENAIEAINVANSKNIEMSKLITKQNKLFIILAFLVPTLICIVFITSYFFSDFEDSFTNTNINENINKNINE